MTSLFKDKTIWITGASSGIGEALAIEFSQSGAKVILSARNEAMLIAVKQKYNNIENLFILPMDIANTDQATDKVKLALSKWGRVDYMIHNAGIVAREFAHSTDMSVYRKIMETNYFGTVALTKALLPSMIEQGGGCFVVVSSLSGKYGLPKLTAYAASKHALHGFFESLRSEMHDQKIKVLFMIPGVIRTDIVANGISGKGTANEKDHSINSRGMDPSLCAKKIISAIRKEKQETLIGGFETTSVYLKRFFPALFSKIIRSHPVKRMRKASGKKY